MVQYKWFKHSSMNDLQVQNLRDAFQSLQTILPAVPPDTKLSKLDILILASAYIGHLGRLLNHANATCSFPLQSIDSGQVIFHPVKVLKNLKTLISKLNAFND